MTQPATDSARNVEDWHHLLLRVAGTIPDEVLTDARDWLAAGDPTESAALVGLAVLAGQVPLWEMDALLLAGELDRGGYDLLPLEDLVLAEFADLPPTRWAFRAGRAADVPDLVDELEVTAEDRLDRDPADRAAIQAVRDEPHATGLWRSWRRPVPGPGAGSGEIRVYLVTVEEDEAAVAGRVQSALKAAGEPNPQVEVCPDGIEPPDYQQAAWSRSALLWAREPTPEIRLARVFDSVDPETGPGFAEDHPRLPDEDEIEHLLDLLEAAPVVLESPDRMDDVLDPERPRVVPLSVRSDGEWIWTDSVAYYLDLYGLAPDPDLLAHLRAVAEPPVVSGVARHRVLSLLLRPSDEEPVWTLPG